MSENQTSRRTFTDLRKKKGAARRALIMRTKREAEEQRQSRIFWERWKEKSSGK